MPARKLKKTTKGKVSKPTLPKSQGKCSGWKAELRVRARLPTALPGGRIALSDGGAVLYILRVRGKCLFPIHGYKVTLKVAVPQGINPAILLLQKVVKPPTGLLVKTPETVNVDYTQRSSKPINYEKVMILPGGPTIPVQLVP